MYLKPQAKVALESNANPTRSIFPAPLGENDEKCSDRSRLWSPSLHLDPCSPRLPPAGCPGPRPVISVLVVENVLEAWAPQPWPTPSSAPYLDRGPTWLMVKVTTQSQGLAQNPSCLIVQGHPIFSAVHTHLLLIHWTSVLHQLLPRPLLSTVRSLTTQPQLPGFILPLRQWSRLPLPSTTKHSNHILTDTWVLGIIFCVWGFCLVHVHLPDFTLGISPVASCHLLCSSTC